MPLNSNLAWSGYLVFSVYLFSWFHAAYHIKNYGVPAIYVSWKVLLCSLSVRVWDIFLDNHFLLFCCVSESGCVKQDSSQIGLLKELLDLQKDMVVMLLSLLEGKRYLSIKNVTFIVTYKPVKPLMSWSITYFIVLLQVILWMAQLLARWLTCWLSHPAM